MNGEKQYTDIKSSASSAVHKWFRANPDYWREKALIILTKHDDYHRLGAEMRRIDPMCSLDWFPLDPISACFGKPTGPGSSSPYIMPEIKDPVEADLAYYTAAIVLHDTAGQGYERITRGIWPKDLCDSAKAAFNAHPPIAAGGSLPCLDKSGFVKAALLHVEEDLGPAPETTAAHCSPAREAKLDSLWSQPLAKVKTMKRIGINSYKKFSTYLKSHAIR